MPRSLSKKKNSSPLRQTPFEILESRQLLSASVPLADLSAVPTVNLIPAVTSTTVKGYTAGEIRKAYGITGTGAGQTIAIVDAYNDTTLSSDLAAFDSKMGLASSTLTVVSETGSTTKLPTADAGWALETSLDVEWAHAIAPGAKILLVEATTSNLSDLLTAINYARSASGVSVVSLSWGSSEFGSETSYNSYFTTPTGHANVSFVASSGDDGYATWPSVDPNVLAVGGTTLSVSDSTGTYSSESAWVDSGGGYSRFEAEPTFQNSAQETGLRSTPDVAYNANPSTGFAVYDSTTYDNQSGWFEVGGTSAGAPQWAAIVALADQTRAAKSVAPLSSASTLGALYSVYGSSSYSTDFHDITTGGSPGFGGFGGNFGGGKIATTGYDLLTGLGSPKAGVITLLSAFTAATTTTTTNTLATFVAGSSLHNAVEVSPAPVATFATETSITFQLQAATPINFESSALASFTTATVPLAGSLLMPMTGSSTIANSTPLAFEADTPAPTLATADPNTFGSSLLGLSAESSINAALSVTPSVFATPTLNTSLAEIHSPLTPAIRSLSASAHAVDAMFTEAEASWSSWQSAALAAAIGSTFLWWWTDTQRRAAQANSETVRRFEKTFGESKLIEFGCFQ